MRQFVLEQNIRRFERALASCNSARERKILSDLLATAKRELAALPDEEKQIAMTSQPRATE